MLQHGRWQWPDGSLPTYIRWANQHQFPTSKNLQLLQNNKIIPTTDAPQITLTLNAYKEDGMCSAAIRAPDFTGPRIFPIDCTINFTSHYVCTPPTSYVQIKISPRTPYSGYEMEQRENISVLQSSQRICPHGYHIFQDYICLKLVTFPAKQHNYLYCSKITL